MNELHSQREFGLPTHERIHTIFAYHLPAQKEWHAYERVNDLYHAEGVVTCTNVWPEEVTTEVATLRPQILALDSLHVGVSKIQAFISSPGDVFKIREDGNIYLLGGDIAGLDSIYEFIYTELDESTPSPTKQILFELAEDPNQNRVMTMQQLVPLLVVIGFYKYVIKQSSFDINRLKNRLIHRAFTFVVPPNFQLQFRNSVVGIKIDDYADMLIEKNLKTPDPSLAVWGNGHLRASNIWDSKKKRRAVFKQCMNQLLINRTRYVQDMDVKDTECTADIVQVLGDFFASTTVWHPVETPENYSKSEIERCLEETRFVSSTVLELINQAVSEYYS